MNNTFGRHLVAEYHGCDASILNDPMGIQSLMEDAVTATDCTIVQTVTHRFSPQGVSVVVVIEESHLSIHTWPEVGYAAVDMYTCGEGDPEKAHAVLLEGLRADRAEVVVLHRGIKTATHSAQVVEHRIDDSSAPSAKPAQRASR